MLKLRRGLKTEALKLMESTIAKATERSAHAIVRRLVSKEDESITNSITTALHRLLHFLFTMSKNPISKQRPVLKSRAHPNLTTDH